MKKFLKLLLGASLFILDQSDRAARTVRERVGGRVDDLSDLAKQKYQVAADRVASASRALRNDENRGVRNALRFAARG